MSVFEGLQLEDDFMKDMEDPLMEYEKVRNEICSASFELLWSNTTPERHSFISTLANYVRAYDATSAEELVFLNGDSDGVAFKHDWEKISDSIVCSPRLHRGKFLHHSSMIIDCDDVFRDEVESFIGMMRSSKNKIDCHNNMMVETIDMNNPIDHIQKRREMAYQALQSHELMKVESALSQCLVSASEHKDEEQTRQYISPVLPFRHLSTPVKSPTSSDFMSSSYSSPLQQNVVMISLHLGYREDITIQLHPPIHAPTMKQLTISAMKQFNISDMVQCTLQPIITPSTTYPINRIPLMLKAVSPHTVLLTTGINVLEEEFYGIFNRLSLSEFEEKFPKKELIFWNANNERINPINLKKKSNRESTIQQSANTIQQKQ
eukprot:331680_1